MKKRKINKNKVMGILTFLILIIIGGCFFLQSDFFNLEKVKVYNNKYLSEADVKKIISINLNRNIFSYNLKELETKINNNLYVESCQVKREIPNKIVIDIKEKKIIGPLYNNKQYVYIDDSGNLIEVVKNIDKEDSVIYMDYEVDKGEILFKENDKKVVINLIENLKNENIFKQIKSIDMNNRENISIKMSKGMTVNINKNDDMETNVKKMRNVLVDLQNRNESYGKLDMTYKEYILYKPWSN